MNWEYGLAMASQIWRPDAWKLACLTALYFVPVARTAFAAFKFGGLFFVYIDKPFGIWECLAAPPRDVFVTAFLASGACWHVWQGYLSHLPEHFITAGVASLLIAAAFLNRRLKRNARLELLGFAKDFPAIHPKEFFDRLACCSGIFGHRLPHAPARTIDPADLDFTNGRAGKYIGWARMLIGAWSTMWCARLIALAGRRRGAKFMCEAASALAVVWASRTAMLARSAVTVEGREFLPETSEPQMFLFTHSSFLDFALCALVLASRPDSIGEPSKNLPVFLLAKDHFRDNFFYYRVLGIGRIAEALGMIFVERGKERSIASARRVTEEAADKIVTRHALAIFPQGARGTTCEGPKGQRRDSAYYTAGPLERVKADGAHLKKGAAHIALEAALKLAQEGRKEPLKIVPVAILGTGQACPKGKMRIAPNTRIKFKVEPQIIVSHARDENCEEYVVRIHKAIDNSLKAGLEVHAVLERRFFEDLRGHLDHMKIEEIAIAMKSWRNDDYLVHAVLDAIYACKPKLWRPFIGELAHHILNFSTREELLAFKGRVAEAAVK